MPIDLRPATETDVESLLRLWLALSAEGEAADPRYRMRRDAADAARIFIASQWLSDVDHRVVLAEAGERIVGFMTARVSPPHSVLQTPTTVMITDAYVDPEQRRAGIGRDLFEALIEWARDRGAEQVEVGTLALDHRAVAFWRSVGFGDWRVTFAQSLVG